MEERKRQRHPRTMKQYEVALKKLADLPVVLDYWAEWCRPCAVIGEHIKREGGRSRFNVIYLDTDAPGLKPLCGDVTTIPLVRVGVVRRGQFVELWQESGASAGFVVGLQKALSTAWAQLHVKG